MGNKVERLLNTVKEKYDDDALENLFSKLGNIDEKARPATQSKYMKALLEELTVLYGNKKTAELMRPSGHQCISSKTIKTAKGLYDKTNSIDEFLMLLNEQNIGGGNLHTEDNKIIAVYDECYCGITKHAKGILPVYCECSAGWFEKLFSSVFGKEVDVRRVSTILDGSEKCTFQIKI
jgi:predicted ArsR family transcriptional regulator